MLTAPPTLEPALENFPPSWRAPAPGLPGSQPEPAPAELVLVFASTTEVLNAEDRLETEDFDFALIPVPKEVNPNCGLALSISEETGPDIGRALAQAGLSPLAVYRRQGEEFKLLLTI